MKLYVFKNQVIRFIIALIPGAGTRTKLIKRIHFFKEMGEHVHFQPRHLPADPKFIRIHNNVSIASDVTFITHDIMQNVFNNFDQEYHDYKSHLGCIEIMDNVFIGSNTTILPDVRIGPNVIVAAGAVVTKDVPEGSLVGGVPARVIGSFDDIMTKRREESLHINENNRVKRIIPEWEKFYKKRNKQDII